MAKGAIPHPSCTIAYAAALAQADEALHAALAARPEEAASDLVLSAINSEEELSGPMPDEMWDAIKAEREACMEAMRIAVRMTKEGIRDRYLAAFGRAAMNNGEGK